MNRILALGVLLSVSAGGADAAPRVWHSFDDAPSPYLQYSRLGSADARRLTIACDGERGMVTFEQVLPPSLATSNAGTLRVASGAVAADGAAKVGPDERDGGAGTTYAAAFAQTSPIVQQFAATGRIQTRVLGVTTQPPPAPRSMRRSFLAICRR